MDPLSTHDELGREVYDTLRELAQAWLRRERAGHTLQPTALVHEAYLRLAESDALCAGETPATPSSLPATPGLLGLDDRTRLQVIAAHVMRRVLVDHARRRGRQRRGGGWRRVDGSGLAAPDEGVDVLALDDAMAQLAAEDERAARVVELRFFGGLSVEHAAALLGVSTRTVELDWRFARARLLHALSEAPS